MSLRRYSLWEVVKHAFSKEVWDVLWPAIGDTLYMVIFTAVITLVLGIMLGIVLAVTGKEGITPVSWLHRGLGTIINCLRSLPQIIMIIITLPLARALLGKAYGVNACIIALAASCTPMFARLIEGALLELEKGKIEAAKSMGSTNLKIIFGIMLPEVIPAMIRAFTVALIAIISMTALAGNFGAGGVGDIAVRFGFNRFQHDMLIATVFSLIVMVQVVQTIGDVCSKLILKKRHLI
ncbi:MAG: ABC transporter permease [Clostridiales bacterium]|nr:ABC transporter permease [Clostridiales bacterium]